MSSRVQNLKHRKKNIELFTIAKPCSLHFITSYRLNIPLTLAKSYTCKRISLYEIQIKHLCLIICGYNTSSVGTSMDNFFQGVLRVE